MYFVIDKIQLLLKPKKKTLRKVRYCFLRFTIYITRKLKFLKHYQFRSHTDSTVNSNHFNKQRFYQFFCCQIIFRTQRHNAEVQHTDLLLCSF